MAYPGTVLFTPWGNNNGHVTHCLALARAAQKRGWHTVVAHHGDPLHERLIAEAGCEATRYPRSQLGRDMWDCWMDEAYIAAAVEADLALIERFGAAAVVHDIRISSPIAAAAAGVPYAAICHETLTPGFAFAGLGVSSLWTRSNAQFNRTLARYGQAPVREDLRELLTRGVVVVPSVPEFDALPEAMGTAVVYTGPLSLELAPEEAENLPARDGKGVFFYRTVGLQSRLGEFREAFGDLGDRVFIATGTEGAATELRSATAGSSFRIRSLWDMDVIRGAVSAAVHHGGPGTCLSCLAGRLPSVVLPGDNPERAHFGDRVQSLGMGVSLSRGTSLGTSWGAAVDSTGNAPPWAEVRRELDRLIDDPAVRAGAGRWARLLTGPGAASAFDAVDALETAIRG